ncbi:hypothetical protein [Aestuariivirga sp.]|uniref:hypothetical protein n=1 Tax=Aestuariivirga sp. TaxID=2650926 RepID=UPI0039E608D5
MIRAIGLLVFMLVSAAAVIIAAGTSFIAVAALAALVGGFAGAVSLAAEIKRAMT